MFKLDIWDQEELKLVFPHWGKEVLKLNKRAKYYLHKIINLCKPQLKYPGIKLDRHKYHDYKFEFIGSDGRSTSHNKQLKKWLLPMNEPINIYLNDDIQVIYKIESIIPKPHASKIDNLKKEETSYDINLKKYSISIISPQRLYRYGSIAKKQMPSKIETSLKQLTNEKLTNSVTIVGLPKNNKLLTAMKSNPYLEYQISRIFVHHSHSSNNSKTLLFWKLPSVTDISLDLIKISKKLYQEEFNEIEFFKLKISKTVPRRPKFEYRFHSWKIDKVELKALDWDPFRSHGLKFKENNPTWETIESIHFHLNYDMVFHFSKLHNGYLDLIVDTTGYIGIMDQKPKTNICINDHNNFKEDNNTNIMIKKNKDKEKEDSTWQSSTNDSSMLPQKRTFINSELLSVIQSKKKQKIDVSDSSNYLDNTKFIKLLQEPNEDYSDELTQRKDVKVQPRIDNTRLRFTKFNSNLGNANQTIIANETKLAENIKIINEIKAISSVNIEEIELCLPCDFQIGPYTCAILLNINKIFQLSPNGELVYTNTIMQLLCQNKFVYLLIEYDQNTETFDKDIFWKVRILFAHPKLKAIFIERTSTLRSYWIAYLSRTNKEIMHTDPAFTFLGVNPFQEYVIKKETNITSLLDLLHNISQDCKTVERIIPDVHLELLKKLIHEKWTVR